MSTTVQPTVAEQFAARWREREELLLVPGAARSYGATLLTAESIDQLVALDERDSVRDALELWEARERPLTDHTQRRAGEIAAQRVLAGGMDWDDEGMRAARHIPTGASEMALG